MVDLFLFAQRRHVNLAVTPLGAFQGLSPQHSQRPSSRRLNVILHTSPHFAQAHVCLASRAEKRALRGRVMLSQLPDGSACPPPHGVPGQLTQHDPSREGEGQCGGSSTLELFSPIPHFPAASKRRVSSVTGPGSLEQDPGVPEGSFCFQSRIEEKRQGVLVKPTLPWPKRRLERGQYCSGAGPPSGPLSAAFSLAPGAVWGQGSEVRS